jgi:hypothetical protein
MNNLVYFPIKTETACQSKWAWSTIYLNAMETASCHRVKPISFSLEDFDNFHNIPKKLDDRRLMLEGKWPTGGCEYCQRIEEVGGFSDRMHNLDIPGLTPPEVIADQTSVEVTPQIVEIFAQNTCNLACVYCNSELSSKIEQENKKYGEFNHKGVMIPVTQSSTSMIDQYFAKFIDWLDRNVQKLKRLHLLGGETFIQHELMESVLAILEKRPNPELEFCIFSNFNAPEKYWNSYINKIKDLQSAGNIKRFDLTCSVDCWGPEASYVRSGLKLELLEARLDWAASQSEDWLYLNVNQTVTSMTIKTMPELINRINKYNKHRHIGHYFQFYTGRHMFQHPQIYAYSTWEKDFENILAAMPTHSIHQADAIPRMQGLQKQLQQVTEHNYPAIGRLHIYLDELDRRRGTDWRSLFPYLIV